MSNKKPRVLVLFSGGLDSILTAKILIKQKLNILAITFKSYFFNGNEAKLSAQNLSLNLKIIDFSNEHLKIVKKPKYGYGKNMNPCIDCHILMLKYAKQIMIKNKIDFIATGEVLGERPMSQNASTLKLIEKQVGLDGYILRPLSAKLLSKTIPEKMKLIDREKLFAISGRSRKKQIELAKKWKIKSYPTPAGGCLLTDPEFSKKLGKLFIVYPNCQKNDVLLLKYGRHFWEKNYKIIIGRNKEENNEIEKLAKKDDVLIQMENYPGPSTIIRNYSEKKNSQAIIKKACDLTQYYSTKARNKKNVKFKITLL